MALTPTVTGVISDIHNDIQEIATSPALPTGSATAANQATMIASLDVMDDAVRADGSTLAARHMVIGGIDGSTFRTLAATSSRELKTSDANQGKAPVVVKSGSAATYDGTEIEVTGLTASTPYMLTGATMRVTLGTAGNTTQPSIGEATGFAQGDMDDRYKMSAAITLGDARTVDNLADPIIVTSDANGKLYIKGASPAATDSTLSYRLDLIECRDGA